MVKTSRGLRWFMSVLLVFMLLPVQAFTVFGGQVKVAHAAVNTQGDRYYGNQLDKNASYPTGGAFYKALENMDFTTGNGFMVEDAAILKQAEAYANGDDALIRNFGAAVDSFKYDHSEIFYVDWLNLSVNVYKKGGKFLVEIGSGRTDSYFLNPNETPATIQSKVAAFNSALTTLAGQVTGSGDKAIAKSATEKVAAATEYSFFDDAAKTSSYYIHTAYGALINKHCVCEGYSRLYKLLLDRKGVQCELVQGNYVDGNNSEPHMWNYVKTIENERVQDPDYPQRLMSTGKTIEAWYGVDVTALDGHSINSSATPSTGGVPGQSSFDKYFWRTSETFSLNHYEDPEISSTCYPMPYPKLYSLWVTPTWSGRFDCGIGLYDGKEALWFSYDGKTAGELQKEGLWMAFRVGKTNLGVYEISPYQSVKQWNLAYAGAFVDDSANHRTWFTLYNKSVAYMEIGIFDIEDDKVYSSLTGSRYYSQDGIANHLVETTFLNNPSWDATVRKLPLVTQSNTSPDRLFQERQNIKVSNQHYKVAFDDDLQVLDASGKRLPDNQIDLSYYVSSYNNSDLKNEVVYDICGTPNGKISNAKLSHVTDSKGTHGVIEFDFTPSKQFNHNLIWYNFKASNVFSVLPEVTEANKIKMNEYKDICPYGVPLTTFSLVYSYTDQQACKAYYGDGRLRVNTYAQPMLVSTSDMSAENWTNADGTRISEGQRSQMALVVTAPQDEQSLVDATKGHVSDSSAIMQSNTYEIDFNICGANPVIPDGSYVTINLGIPDSFKHLVDSGSKEITFQLYHFKKKSFKKDDKGNIYDVVLDYDHPEIIPCTLTKYGLIAKVSSFSPFVLAAVDNSKLHASEKDTSHKVTLLGDERGGKVSISGDEAVKAGGSVTYTFKPDAGYQLECVYLNGKKQSLAGNSITLMYDELFESNVLTYSFASSKKLAEEASAGYEVVYSPLISTDGSYDRNSPDPMEKQKISFKKANMDKEILWSKVKKSKQTFKIGATAKTKLTYKAVKYLGKAKNHLKVNSNGKVEVKKGTMKGVYRVKLKISAAQSSSYHSATTNKVLVVRVVDKYTNKVTKATTSKTIAASKVAKSKQTFKINAKAGTKVAYKTAGYMKAGAISKAKAKKYVSVSNKGVVTIKKGAPAGTYKVKVKMSMKANKTYRAGSETKTIVIKVE